MRRNARYRETHARLARELGRKEPPSGRFAATSPVNGGGERAVKATRRFVPGGYSLPSNYVTAEQLRAELQDQINGVAPEEKPERPVRNYWND